MVLIMVDSDVIQTSNIYTCEILRVLKIAMIEIFVVSMTRACGTGWEVGVGEGRENTDLSFHSLRSKFIQTRRDCCC